jgi:hypothetical protein
VIAEIFEQLNSVGFSEQSCILAKGTIETVINSVGDGLLGDINKIFKDKESFYFKKSYMSSVIVINLARSLPWISRENINSLSISCFFNDKFLDENDMNYVTSEYELETSQFAGNDKQFRIIQNHALLCSQWISDFEDIPSEVSRIIKQHHGSINGIGFPKQIHPQVTQLSLVFMLAEEFSHRILLSKGGKLNVVSILQEIKDKYQTTKLHEYIDTLKNLLKKEIQG